MPFTLSHPAAVLPIHARAPGLSLSALVIGSMAPDFAYFLPFGSWGRFSHSFVGIFVFCIPAGLLGYFIVHVLVKEPIWRILPWSMRCRLDPKCSKWKVSSVSSLLKLVGIIAIGALTHVIWDSFTHRHGEFVRLFGMLRQTMSMGNISLPIYRLLQHLSSVFGLCILILAIHRWVKRAPVLYTRHVGESSRNSVLTLSVLAMLSGGGAIAGFFLSDASMVERKLVEATISGMGALAGASFLYCLFVQLNLHPQRHDV